MIQWIRLLDAGLALMLLALLIVYYRGGPRRLSTLITHAGVLLLVAGSAYAFLELYLAGAPIGPRSAPLTVGLLFWVVGVAMSLLEDRRRRR